MTKKSRETAVLAGGCFWCTEAIFNRLRGVISAVPGYAGGTKNDPTYEEVSLGNTGHAEAVKIEYDPSLISFEDLLTVFFNTHDPTTINRQGNDVGPQYRSVIFYMNESQIEVARNMISELNSSNAYEKPVVTGVAPFTNFFVAEDYHRQYYEKHKNAPYCEIVIAPKMEKLQNKFQNLLK